MMLVRPAFIFFSLTHLFDNVYANSLLLIDREVFRRRKL